MLYSPMHREIVAGEGRYVGLSVWMTSCTLVWSSTWRPSYSTHAFVFVAVLWYRVWSTRE